MKVIKKKSNKRFIRHEQWIEVMQKDGKTVTTFTPPNQEFERLRLEMDPPPDMIYRRLNFFNGIPEEYMWALPTPQLARWGGQFLQRILPEDWPAIFQA